MINDTFVVQWHEENVAAFKLASNGSRNNTLNAQALKSFSLALGDPGKLSTSRVEADYISAAKGLQMDDAEVVKTLQSALRAATPYAFDDTHKTDAQGKQVSKENLKLAPVYTALEDYAAAHGVPVQVFNDAKWVEGEHEGRKCLKVPHEDRVIRCRFIDGNKPKWKPIGTNVKPCLYGFKSAIEMAKVSAHKTIVLTNGQPSVVVAQHYNVPALAQTDGEGKKIGASQMRRLLDAINQHNLQLIIAMDGDDAGRAATGQRAQQFSDNGIAPRTVLFGGDDGYDLADYCAQHTTNAMDNLLQLSAFNQKSNVDEYDSGVLADDFENLLAANVEGCAPGTSIPIPFKSFHSLGGYAYMTAPGKLAMVMAPSGHGKTSFMETWVDQWLKDGTDVLWYSPEWEAEETYYRRVQRNGGATYDDIRLLKMYYDEQRQGIPKAHRVGRLWTPELKHTTYNVIQNLRKWPGQIFCYKAQRITETTLELMAKRLHRQRRDGRRVGVAVFDYMQLMRTATDIAGKNVYEAIGDMLKDWCMDNHVFGLVGMQVKKSSSQSNELLGMYDAQWVRPDIFNLIVTLNIPMVEEYVGGVGVKKMSTYATANICKNSTGQTGERPLVTNFKYLSWMERSNG